MPRSCCRGARRQVWHLGLAASNQACRSHHALCRLCARRSAAAQRADGRAETAGEADRAGRRLVRRQDPARHPAAGERSRRAHRVKTGTSYGYRDAWAVGFDGKRTIGVWVGRPDGAPVSGLAGRTAAAPILFDAFARGPQPLAPLPPAPAGALMATTAKLPPPLQRFQPHAVASASFTRPLHIVFPPNGASLELSAMQGEAPDPLPIKISGGTPPRR